MGSSKSTNLSSCLFNSFSFHIVHLLLLLSTCCCPALCACMWSVSSPWLLVFLSHSPLLLDVSLKFTDCTQILLADFNLCPLSGSLFPPKLPRSYCLYKQSGAQPVELSVLPLPGCLVSLSVSQRRYFRPTDLLSEGLLLLGHEAGPESSHAVHILLQQTKAEALLEIQFL